MLTYFLVCPAAIEADSSVNFNAALSLPKNTNRNNITERNGGDKKLSLSSVVVKHAIMPTVMEQQQCYEVCVQCLRDGDETSLQTQCVSSNRC